MNPQPEVHMCAATTTSRYESVGRVVYASASAPSIMKVSFVTEPPARGG